MAEENKSLETAEHDTQFNTRIEELDRKPDRTEEETKELGELKQKRHKSAQAKINEFKWKWESTREELEKERKERERIARELEEARQVKETTTRPSLKKDETVKIGSKEWFTDEALIAKRDAGEITEYEAYQYQRKRDKEELKAEILQEQEQKVKQQSEEETRRKDAQKVLAEYPHFSKEHKDYNPNDPLFKTAMELWQESYRFNPEGLSKSIARAKQILRMSDTKPDLSDEFSTHAPSGGKKPSTKEKEVSFSKDEEEAAIRMYTRTNNPATGRPYTEAESIAKGKRAKEARLSLRRRVEV